MSAPTAPSSLPADNLPPISRYITIHDPSTGLSHFSFMTPMPKSSFPTGGSFTLAYTTEQTPVNCTNNADVQAYDTNSADTTLPATFTTTAGTVLRHVETPPGGVSPMHRTTTVDYMVVLQGEMELILDSGETRKLRPGDTVVQRGTMHAWRNCSETEWVRMLAVMMPMEPLEVAGKVLETEFRGPPQIKKE